MGMKSISSPCHYPIGDAEREFIAERQKFVEVGSQRQACWHKILGLGFVLAQWPVPNPVE